MSPHSYPPWRPGLITVWIFSLYLLKDNKIALALPNLMDQGGGNGDIFVGLTVFVGFSFCNLTGCLAFLLVRNLKEILNKVEKSIPQES